MSVWGLPSLLASSIYEMVFCGFYNKLRMNMLCLLVIYVSRGLLSNHGITKCYACGLLLYLNN